MRAKKALDWRSIDHVLLDLDGTLLDKHFDKWFWNEFVPRKYAEAKGITLKEAKARKLFEKYWSSSGGLKWYDLNYWSRKLGIDIISLNYEARHLIRLHPDAVRFLKLLKRQRKRVFLVTNVHRPMLRIKMRKTGIAKYFDRVVSAFDVGVPKEKTAFWVRAQRRLGFAKERTLLVDDEEKALAAARHFGIKQAVLIRREGRKAGRGLAVVRNFDELIRRAE